MSVDAAQDNETLVAVVDEAARPDGVDGAVVSGAGQVAVEVISVSDGDWLPGASYAATPMMYVVPQARPDTVYDVPVVVPTTMPLR